MTILMTKQTLMALATVATFAIAAPAFAAGGETPTCPSGQVYDEATKSCVKKTSQLNDTQIYELARQYAYAGQYDEALDMLKRAENQNDPRILNYYGYTNRKLGNVDVAMSYYQRAIAIDGNYLLARSYMGQGMIKQGDLEGARAQLVEIRDRGGKDTYAYKALYEALKSGSTY
jgi:tetratricopeptide (TPR) repeat protein